MSLQGQLYRSPALNLTCRHPVLDCPQIERGLAARFRADQLDVSLRRSFVRLRDSFRQGVRRMLSRRERYAGFARVSPKPGSLHIPDNARQQVEDSLSETTLQVTTPTALFGTLTHCSVFGTLTRAPGAPGHNSTPLLPSRTARHGYAPPPFTTPHDSPFFVFAPSPSPPAAPHDTAMPHLLSPHRTTHYCSLSPSSRRV